MSLNDFFHKLSTIVSNKVGSPWVFILALLIIVVWAVSGPIFSFSDTWQLVINTGTTIVTFLMVFVIQNTQNRDNKALQLKLDELLRAEKGARNELVDVEDLSDAEIKALDEDFKRIHEEQAASPLTIKLRQKIEAEHSRRRLFRRSNKR